MSQLFSYPEFDDQGVKVLSRAGEGEGPDDMMMNITVYRMKAGDERTFCLPEEEMAVLLVKGDITLEQRGKKREERQLHRRRTLLPACEQGRFRDRKSGGGQRGAGAEHGE